jgi:hypothetical protein
LGLRIPGQEVTFLWCAIPLSLPIVSRVSAVKYHYFLHIISVAGKVG